MIAAMMALVAEDMLSHITDHRGWGEILYCTIDSSAPDWMRDAFDHWTDGPNACTWDDNATYHILLSLSLGHNLFEEDYLSTNPTDLEIWGTHNEWWIDRVDDQQASFYTKLNTAQRNAARTLCADVVTTISAHIGGDLHYIIGGAQ